MAAVSSCRCGCPCILRTALRRQPLSIRCLSSQTKGQSKHSTSGNAQDKRKRRDHSTVLKALSSTVQKVPGSTNIGFLEDAFLTPRSDFTKREYIAALESGRNAAEFIIKKYPDLCDLRQAVPAWPDEFAVFEEKEDEETLEFLIKSEKLEEAIKLYELLEQKGDALGTSTLNLFLDFVGYHGVGIVDPATETPEAADDKESSSSSSDSDSSSDDEGTISNKSEGVSTHGFKVKGLLLSENGYAAKIFSSITDKTSETYEAYILALLKHGEFDVACTIHDEMREKQFKGSAYLYKMFIDQIDILRKDLKTEEKWNLAEKFLTKMKEEKSATPDIGLYNALLKLASQLGESASTKCGMLFREMVANGIEPSLGSYLYILEANDAKKTDKFNALNEIVHRVYNHKGRFQVQDTRDVTFFIAAMNMARGFGNAELAKMLMETAYRDGNWTLLGRSISAFLGNYIATLARAESDVDFVFEEYNRLVPNELVPRDWVYAELFNRLERGERPEKIFTLCNDMKVNRVRLTYPICERIFVALSAPMPQELLKEALEAALETMKWMAMFDIPVTGVVLAQVARLYAKNGMLNDAVNTVNLFEEKEIKPSFEMLRDIMNAAAEIKDEGIVLKLAKQMKKHNYSLSEKHLNDLFAKIELGDSQRSQLLEIKKSN